MRWLMCFTDAAFRRTAWGSRPKEDAALYPVAETGAGVLTRLAGTAVASSWTAATGMAAVAGSGRAAAVGRTLSMGWTFSVGRTTGIADVGGPGVVDAGAAARAASTTGIAAVAGSGRAGAVFGSAGSMTALAARSRSAARAAARVVGAAWVGAATVGIAAVAGSAWVGFAVAGSGNPLAWARRRPVGLVRSRSSCARRGLSMVGDMVLPLNACEVSCRVRTRPSGRAWRLHPKGLRRKQARETVGPPSLPRVWRILECGRARRQSRSGPAEIGSPYDRTGAGK